MFSRRLAAAGLSLAAALTFTVAGCGDSGTDGGTKSAATPADPAAELANATDKLAKTSFKVKADMGEEGTITGAMDSPNLTGTMTMKMAVEQMTMTMDMLLIKTDMYMKMDMGDLELPGVPTGKWMHINVSDLPEDNSLGVGADFDLVGTGTFLKAVNSVEKASDGTYKGTLDLSKVTDTMGVDEAGVKALGEAAKKIPFEATLDDQGRLTKLVIELPKMGESAAHKMTTTYSDFGTTVTVKKPKPSEITKAPADLLKSFE